MSDIINTQDANSQFVFVVTVIASWMMENGLQIIPAVIAVVGMIFMIKRYYEDKKKRDIDMELAMLRIKALKDSAE